MSLREVPPLHLELVTDHKPLEVIYGPKSRPCARVERWVLRMQPYKFKVRYQPGPKKKKPTHCHGW